jgi:hypothetical protein
MHLPPWFRTGRASPGVRPTSSAEENLMTLDSQTTTVRTAFLALDFATYILENFSYDAAVAERASRALASARAAGCP